MKRHITNIIFLSSFAFVIWFFTWDVNGWYKVLVYGVFFIIVTIWEMKTAMVVDENGNEINRKDFDKDFLN